MKYSVTLTPEAFSKFQFILKQAEKRGKVSAETVEKFRAPKPVKMTTSIAPGYFTEIITQSLFGECDIISMTKVE